MIIRTLSVLYLGLLISCTESSKGNDDLNIFIRVCAAGVEMELKDGKYYFSSDWPQRKDTEQILSADIEKVKTAVEDIFKKPEDEYWSVFCMNDGFSMKLYLTLEGQKKKIFISNYFDHRYNIIALVLNKYLPENPEILYRLPYGITDPVEINRALERSKNNPECQAPDHHIQRMLHEWCES